MKILYVIAIVLAAMPLLGWLDQGSPWAFFTLEETAYNVDVSEYIRARGQ